MLSKAKFNKQGITILLATELIAEQFPQWAHLPIGSVKINGWDNTTFRLGDTLSIRLPNAAEYAEQVQKEQHWLPKLAAHLSVAIPEPIALGQPAKNYPWHWSVYRWLEGENANLDNIDDMFSFATELAEFLKQFHKINATDGPAAGAHNFYRGGDLSVYDAETRAAIFQLRELIDVNAVTSVWEKAINSPWHDKPVWVHGDFCAANILVKGGRLNAIIDFGCIGVGDPACDLMIAWTFLNDKNREIFKSQLCFDTDTWARACGWTLWKALIAIVALDDKAGSDALQQLQVINSIVQAC